MKKAIIWLAILSMIIIVFSGCGANTSKDVTGTKDVTIHYFTFSPGDTHEKDLQAMIKAFEEQNSHIKVEYEMAAYNDYFTKLQTQIAGDEEADTFELNYENFVSYAAKDALLDLDSLIKADTSFDSSKINKRALEAFQYNGKQYGMVESFSNVVLFYNKDLFDAKKVAYPQPDWTWQDELKAAEKLTDKDKGIWGTYSPIQFWEFYKTIAQNGGSIFNKDNTKVTINSPQNVETLQWMVDKINKYHVTPTDKEMSGQANEDLFKAGKIAMLRSGIWMFGSFKDAPFNWDIALEPGNTQKAHHFFANGLAISKNTKHPEAAWKWIQFMSASKEAAKIRVDSSWELPAVNDPALVNAYLEQTPPASRQVVFDALNSLVVPPVIEKENEMTDMIGKELDKVKLAEETPKQALDNLQIKLEDLIKK